MRIRDASHAKKLCCFAAAEFPMEPGAGVGPLAVGGSRRYAEHLSNLGKPQAREISELNHFGRLGLDLFEPMQRFIKSNNVLGRRRSLHLQGVKRLPFNVATALVGLPAAGMVDENSPHRLRGGREKVGAVLPTGINFANQAEICLMHQGCRLERMTGRFDRHAMTRQPAQLVINQRQQLTSGLGLTRVDRPEDLRDVRVQSGQIVPEMTAAPLFRLSVGFESPTL